MARDVLANPDHRRAYDETGALPEDHQEENLRAQVYAAASDLCLP